MRLGESTKIWPSTGDGIYLSSSTSSEGPLILHKYNDRRNQTAAAVKLERVIDQGHIIDNKHVLLEVCYYSI